MKALVFLAAAMAFSGCSLKTLALRTTAQLLDGGAKAFYEEADPALAKDALGSQLKLVEGLLETEPGNRSLRLLAAQGFSSYAFLFLEDSEPERARAFYLRGRDHALTLLGWNPAMTLQQLEQALQKSGRAQVPELYWAAQGWAGAINLARDSADSIADLPKAVLIMNWARTLWPDYNFAGADLFFGVYYASRPKILGGDPVKAREHFEAARKHNRGQFLMADVLEAKTYAVAVQDQQHFTNLLTHAAEAPSGRLPLSRLADEVARQKARQLLEKTNDYF